MNPSILVLGTEAELQAFKRSPLSVLPISTVVLDDTVSNLPSYSSPFDWIINLSPDSSFYNYPESDLIFEAIENYLAEKGILFCQSVIHHLQMQYPYFEDYVSPDRIFGLNLLPTFAERSLLEIAKFRDTTETISEILRANQISFAFVEDSPGLVAARTVSMIINEAAFLLLEKAATPEDIDSAMKLGTNYPYGPIEWSKKIGLANIYAILKSLESYSGARIQICPLLAEKAINGMDLA
ncbi:MAG: 3-hydroxyacyl-CoA dehydrogenase family protein [Bacteroidia bacterium]|nr:3-hydroxyacyl-CoA dehydrogenase family protein [Bacteroidia bacterium]